MTKLHKQISSVLLSVVLLLSVAGPAFAGTTIEISGNGAGSDNYANVAQTTNTVVNQNNNANVSNHVDADADTGNNDANFNTGGDVLIGTGDAYVGVAVENSLNTNSAEVECCIAGHTDVEISGNGAFSDNLVDLFQHSSTQVNQNNNANVSNRVYADADTGKNDANLNTGGDVIISTGNAQAEVDISTHANTNVASVSDHNFGNNPSASFVITGNGAGSDNWIAAHLAKLTNVNQNNNANISNYVDADADTGKNDANFNTGGDVLIGTGHAVVLAEVDNMVNFNFADVDCGCTWDVLAKIAGNGADPHHFNETDDTNGINLFLLSEQFANQNNNANLDNDLDDLEADTGKNDVEKNTADHGGDPAIVTGNAVVQSGISNDGNVNVLGDGPFDFEWPDLPDVDFSFNMSAFWAFWGLSN